MVPTDTHPTAETLGEAASLVALVLDDAGIPFEVDGEGAVRAICEGTWHGFDVWFVENNMIDAMHVCACLRQVETAQLEAFQKIVSLLNERLWLGHLELWREASEIVWRYTLPNPGGAEYSADQVQAILQGVRDAADRLAPVCEMIIQGVCAPEDALDNALFETVGEA